MILSITTEKGNTVDVEVAVAELDLTTEDDRNALCLAVSSAIGSALEADAETDVEEDA